MRHRSEIAPDAVLEVNVYAPVSKPQIDAENQALIDLLHSWQEEDATNDPQELERRDAETSDLLINIQRNRLSLRG
jgi:hypothetical protein